MAKDSHETIDLKPNGKGSYVPKGTDMKFNRKIFAGIVFAVLLVAAIAAFLTFGGSTPEKVTAGSTATETAPKADSAEVAALKAEIEALKKSGQQPGGNAEQPAPAKPQQGAQTARPERKAFRHGNTMVMEERVYRPNDELIAAAQANGVQWEQGTPQNSKCFNVTVNGQKKLRCPNKWVNGGAPSAGPIGPMGPAE